MRELKESDKGYLEDVCKRTSQYFFCYRLSMINMDTIIIIIVFACMNTEAVYRYYESRRRKFNDSKPGRQQKVDEQRKQSKKRVMQKQVKVLCCSKTMNTYNTCIHITLNCYLAIRTPQEESQGKRIEVLECHHSGIYVGGEYWWRWRRTYYYKAQSLMAFSRYKVTNCHENSACSIRYIYSFESADTQGWCQNWTEDIKGSPVQIL